MKLFRIVTPLLAVLGTSQVCQASSAGAAAMKALREIDYRFFVAGGTCAAISHGITTPIDVVKTRIQANPKVGLCCYMANAFRLALQVLEILMVVSFCVLGLRQGHVGSDGRDCKE